MLASGKDLTIPNFVVYIIMFISILGFSNLIISILYISDLKNTNCSCSEDIRREVYYYYNLIIAGLCALNIVLLFIVSFIFFLFFRT